MMMRSCLCDDFVNGLGYLDLKTGVPEPSTILVMKQMPR
jgi:hypothetical protein